jgi:transposase
MQFLQLKNGIPSEVTFLRVFRLLERRWLVERTLEWLHRFRRLRIRYDCRADIHQGFLSLACAIVSLRFVERFC